ncbi:hypothetical protein Tco_0748142 [Tanacetum coccineum]|uniref:CCHC-type domain-containing protein n=1 Tax=Tanacetum coccineum TaxID=301880 RepID=A0ABQ4YXB2_9ASTR
MNAPITFPLVLADDVSDEPLVIEANQGSFNPNPDGASGFLQRAIVPDRKGRIGSSIRRTGMRELRAVWSTIYAMIKFPTQGELLLWSPEQLLCSNAEDYPIWEVIQKGNGPVQVLTDTNRQIRGLPPKTAEEILARERERKARTTLLMSIPEDHLAKFHKMTDAKDMWEAIKSIFGGNDESKKMQKYILKQQFEIFFVSNSEGLHKGYDRFQSLLSQLEIHGAGVSTEDANQKFLRSLPASWSQVSLIIRTKPGVDTLSFYDLYNNLRVFESDIKGSTASSSSTHNVAFVSSESTNSTNDVSTAYGVSTSSGYNSQKEGSSLYTDELKYSFFDNQSSGPQLDHEDLEQKTGRRLQFDANEPVGFDKTKVEYFNCHNTRHFARECRSKGNQESRRRDVRNTGYKVKDNGRRPGKQEEPKALVSLDGDGVDWTGHAEDEQENFALMAHSNSGSNTEKLLAEAVKEKEELKTKLENFQSSSKGLSKLLNSQMSTRDKFGLGFAKVEGMHAVPPPMTGIYMPSKSDFGIDKSKFSYGPKQSKTSESDAKTSDTASCESNSSVETLDSVSKSAVNEPTVVSKSKVWSDAPIIEEYESDSDDEYVIEPSKEQEKPSFAFVNTVKHVKTPRETVKEKNTCSPIPKADKRVWNGLMSKKLGLGYGFTKKACFVCGSFSHLIRDCDFHEKRMAKQVELNKQKGKGTSQGENRPVWNNVQRLNHQNKFVPKAVLTKTGIFPVNTARQNLSGQAATTMLLGNRETAVRPQQVVYGDPKTLLETKSPNYYNDPQKALKNKGIVDSRCSRHMTGNKSYLVEYQDYNGGHVAFEGSKGYISGKGHNWLFDLDYLTDSMNYQPVTAENKANKTTGPKEVNHSASTQDNIDAGNSEMEAEPAQEYFVLPLWSSYTSTVKSSEEKNGDKKPNGDIGPKTK